MSDAEPAGLGADGADHALGDAQVRRGRKPVVNKAMQLMHEAGRAAVLKAQQKALSSFKTIRTRLQALAQQLAQVQLTLPNPAVIHDDPTMVAMFQHFRDSLLRLESVCRQSDVKLNKLSELVGAMGANFVAVGNNTVTVRKQYQDLINAVNGLRSSEVQLSKDVMSNGESIAELQRLVQLLEERVPLRDGIVSPHYSPFVSDEGDGVGDMETDEQLQDQQPSGLGVLRLSGKPATDLPDGFQWVKAPDGDWLVFDKQSRINITQGAFFGGQGATDGQQSRSARPPSGDGGFAMVSSRMPQPQKFSGEQPNEDLDEALFAFENYLKGTGVHRDRWSVVAMPLLTGSALRAYTNFAQPMGASGITPTWEQFKAVLQPFARPDKQITSRQSLYSIKQTKSVTEYHQRFLLLVSRAGSPAPTDKDLLMLYWNGLSDEAQKTSIIDPTTGKFWESSLLSPATP